MSAKCSATARLAQSVEHETLNLRVVGSSPTLGVFSFYVRFKKNNCTSAFHFYFKHDQFCYQGDLKLAVEKTHSVLFVAKKYKKEELESARKSVYSGAEVLVLRPC